MSDTPSAEMRYIGLDVHKHYLVAVGVDQRGDQTFGPYRVGWNNLKRWVQKHLTPDDAIVLEVTTNAFSLHDELLPHVRSVTVVHSAHVRLIARARIKTDRKAALILARLHAAGLLPGVWVPPEPVRQLRALVAQRSKMVRLATQAKNRLHAVLHRLRKSLPEDGLLGSTRREWWLRLPVSAAEHTRINCDLDTLDFAQVQVKRLTQALAARAAQDDRVPLLVQLPGVSVVTAMTILAAIGTIDRFPSAKRLVGYAGLGAAVHDSGETHVGGRITKAGRRDLRTLMVEAAHAAANTHPHWQVELARLEKRLGYNKAIVAIARKLLVAVWHVLTHGVADRFAKPQQVARKLMTHAHRLGQANRPAGQSVAAYVREQLDRLRLGKELTAIRLGAGRYLKLPPSRLEPATS